MVDTVPVVVTRLVAGIAISCAKTSVLLDLADSETQMVRVYFSYLVDFDGDGDVVLIDIGCEDV